MKWRLPEKKVPEDPQGMYRLLLQDIWATHSDVTKQELREPGISDMGPGMESDGAGGGILGGVRLGLVDGKCTRDGRASSKMSAAGAGAVVGAGDGEGWVGV